MIARLTPFVTRHAVLPPPIVTRPVVLPTEATASTVAPPPRVPLPDTEDDLAVAMPAGSRADESFSSEARLDDEADDSHSVEIVEQTGLMTVLWPLTVFFLAPLALVGATLLLWLVVRALM